MDDLTKLSNDELQKLIEQAVQQISDLGNEMNAVQSIKRTYQDELARRELEAFWEQHPGERLEMGDELLVTKDVLNYLRERSYNRIPSVGEKFTISGWYKANGGFYMFQLGDEAVVDVHIGRRMLAAWLEQQETG